MKKTLTLLVLTGLMLTGCGGNQADNQAAPQPTETATATATATPETVTVPGVVSLTLDNATDQLEALGFEVEAVDIVDGKTIVLKKNWQVMSQDAAEGAQVANGATVHLSFKSLEKVAAEKAAADKAAADKAAAVKAAAAKAAAAKKAAADKAAADKAAADKAAADKAAADKAAAAKRPNKQLRSRRRHRLRLWLPSHLRQRTTPIALPPGLQVPHRCIRGRLATAPVLTAIATAWPASNSRS